MLHTFKQYLAAVLVLAVYVIHKVATRNWKFMVDYKDMDLDSEEVI